MPDSWGTMNNNKKKIILLLWGGKNNNNKNYYSYRIIISFYEIKGCGVSLN